MTRNPNEKYRIYSWKIFQKCFFGLSQTNFEIVIIEMLHAPLQSIMTAGIYLLKDKISKNLDNLDTAFLNSIISTVLLNLNSHLYTYDSDQILDNKDLFIDRIKVISHVVNLCKILKNEEFMVY